MSDNTLPTLVWRTLVCGRPTDTLHVAAAVETEVCAYTTGAVAARAQ